MTRDELVKELKRYGDRILRGSIFLCKEFRGRRYDYWLATGSTFEVLAFDLPNTDRIIAIYVESPDGLEKLEPKKELTDEEYFMRGYREIWGGGPGKEELSEYMMIINRVRQIARGEV